MTEQVSIPSTPLPATVRRSWLRRLGLLVVVIIVVLDLVNLAILGLKTLDRPVSAPSGTLLYATTFDAFNDEWQQFEGQLSSKVTDGSLHIRLGSGGQGTFSMLNHDFADFDVRVDVKRIKATDDFNELGILFRAQNLENYYIFKITNDGAYKIERVKDKKPVELSARHISPAVLIGENWINQLRVVGQGNRFKFYINDQALILCPNGPGTAKSTWSGENCLSNNQQTSAELIDDTFAFGKIGVGSYAYTPGEEDAFDNVLVYAP
jgi:hypothetical protein